MKDILVLDCTLRDGGYCNQWMFGKDNIKTIIRNLVDSKIDVIECGFISNKVSFNEDSSKFPCIESLSEYLPKKHDNSLFVAMINYGEYDVNSLPSCKESMIDGIRLAFHKKNVKPALMQCGVLKEKGYKVFVQAMVSMAYSDSEFLELIEDVNALNPYAFYIVDSFGMMKRKDMIRFFSLIEHNLKESIVVGFHSHNNLQLAYSNALALLEIRSGRHLIIDTSIYGMGRGAGNLNTELFIDCLNEDYDSEYELKPILSTMDEIINSFYQRNPWGYSLPNYLSAIHGAHPNYAGYLSDTGTLTIEMMNSIFTSMDPDKKVEYNREYIKQLYLDCMSIGKIREYNYGEFTSIIDGKIILLIAPGKSSSEKRNVISDYASEKGVVTISINFDYPYLTSDFIFVSNLRRYKDLAPQSRVRCITTSNIPNNDAYLQISYQEYVNSSDIVGDNAGLMLINFLSSMSIAKIVLAGFDGYTYDPGDNYADSNMVLISKKAVVDATNNDMKKMLTEYSKKVPIEFLTHSRYSI